MSVVIEYGDVETWEDDPLEDIPGDSDGDAAAVDAEDPGDDEMTSDVEVLEYDETEYEGGDEIPDYPPDIEEVE